MKYSAVLLAALVLPAGAAEKTLVERGDWALSAKHHRLNGGETWKFRGIELAASFPLSEEGCHLKGGFFGFKGMWRVNDFENGERRQREVRHLRATPTLGTRCALADNTDLELTYFTDVSVNNSNVRAAFMLRIVGKF